MSITYWKLGSKAIAAFNSEKEAQEKLDKEEAVFELDIENKIVTVKKSDVIIYTERR
jgi:hypothetical protein